MITNYVKFREMTLEFSEASLILKKMKIGEWELKEDRKMECIWCVYWIVLWIVDRFNMKRLSLYVKIIFFNRPFPKWRHNIIIFNLIFRKNKVQIRFSRQKICIRWKFYGYI